MQGQGPGKITGHPGQGHPVVVALAVEEGPRIEQGLAFFEEGISFGKMAGPQRGIAVGMTPEKGQGLAQGSLDASLDIVKRSGRRKAGIPKRRADRGPEPVEGFETIAHSLEGQLVEENVLDKHQSDLGQFAEPLEDIGEEVATLVTEEGLDPGLEFLAAGRIEGTQAVGCQIHPEAEPGQGQAPRQTGGRLEGPGQIGQGIGDDRHQGPLLRLLRAQSPQFLEPFLEKEQEAVDGGGRRQGGPGVLGDQPEVIVAPCPRREARGVAEKAEDRLRSVLPQVRLKPRHFRAGNNDIKI